MSYSREGRSPSPCRSQSRSPPSGCSSRSRGGSCSRSRDSEDAGNPGNNLYVTGLSPRVATIDLEKYFSREGEAKRRCGRTPTLGRYHGLKDRRGRGPRRSRSYSPRRWRERDHWRDRREGSRSPYGRRVDEYDLHKRLRDRSLSAGSEDIL